MGLGFYAAASAAVILLGLGKSGLSGLGALAVPLMTLSVPPLQAVAITLPILIVQDWVGVYAFRREFDKRNLAILVPASLIGVLIAYLFAAKVSEQAVKLMIGLVSLGFVAVMLARDQMAAAKPTRADVAPGLFWGMVAGFGSFVSHSGGPPFLVYTVPQKMPTPVYAGTSAIFFALVNLMKVPPYLKLGQFSRDNLMASLTLLPLAVASTLAGVWLVRRLPAEKFYKLVLAATTALGVKLVYDAFRALAG